MIQPEKTSPPKWPLKLLRLILKKEYLEEIEGDMEEIFRENLERSTPRIARRRYAWEMLALLRPVLTKNLLRMPTFSQYAMFRNYSKTSVRSLMKNPMSSFINIFGLAVAIGICLVVYTFIEFDASIDQFHKNKNEVYLTTFHADRDGERQQYGTSPRPLGAMLREDFAQIKRVCRVEDGNVVLKYRDNVFHERVRYADPEFLEMFTFPLKWGTSGSLADLNSIVLSEEMAIRYFGDENPVGRDILMIFNEKNSKAFTVTGVAAAFPKARAIEFNFLINYENVRVADPAYDGHDWSKFLNATLIQVDNPPDVRFIEKEMVKYKALQNEVQHDWAISSFSLEPLAVLHSKSAGIRDDISHDDNVEGRIGMPIIAIFMLTLACFNYINIAIVSASKRLKEIGVRKAIGANRGRVIVQFLTENIVVTFFALILGFVLGAMIFLPWFVQFSGWELEVKYLDKNLWIFMVVLLVFTGIASGIYPAFYISKFDAVRIFNGSQQFGRKNPLTTIFLGIQIVLACITITAGVVFTQNNGYQNNRSWGYAQKGALYVSVPHEAAYDKVYAALSRDPNVLQLSGSTDHIGRNVSTAIVRMPPSQKYEVKQLSVDANYIKTMGLQLTDGRDFTNHAENDKQLIIVNELFVKKLNLAKPIGQLFEIDSTRFEVIGVVKDFHMRDFFNRIEPTIFKIADKTEYRYLSLRVKNGSENETNAALQKQWAMLYPEIPFQGGHQEDVWNGYFFYVDRSEIFNDVVASISVLLASLGLYGLVTLNVAGRVREFSIRKTLGAGLKNIASIIVKQYAILAVVALIFGAPISYLFSKAYLDMLFAYPMPMGYSGITIAIVILISVLLAVISTQIRKVSKSNPVEGLKVE